jgi:asparagine synthase (glutamine-hydrolysing)
MISGWVDYNKHQFKTDAPTVTIFHGGEKYVCVFSGNIFNAEELKRDLTRKGYAFDSQDSGELMLKAYIEWGKDCLSRVNGTFAFAVWEESSASLFAARDRAGAKPFFFYPYKNGLIFGSAVKTIMQSGLISPVLDADGLKQILLLGPARSGGNGIIKGVCELKPAQFLTASVKNGTKIETYWKLVANKHTDNIKQTIEKTRFLIEDAVTRQLPSISPAAAFLSGGLDSSIISAIAAKHYKNFNLPFNTFSLDYESNDKFFIGSCFQPETDEKYVKIMLNHLKCKHETVLLSTEDVAAALNEATLAREFPGMADIDSSLLLFANAVSQRNGVFLSGECADEIFGGYPWYHNSEILFNEAFPWSNSATLRKLLFKKEFLGSDADDFLHSEYEKTVKETDFLDTDSKLERRMREMFSLNFYWFMQTLVDRCERMTRPSGIDVRMPFCDYRLVEYAYNMPWQLKSLNNREKGILREAFKDVLPKQITERKKSPFPKTYNPVFLNTVYEKAMFLVNDKKSILNEIVNKSFLQDLKNESYQLTTPWYGQLMRVPQIFAYLIQIDAFFKNFNLEIKI